MADLVDLALIDDDEAVLDALLHYLTRQNVRTSCFNAAKNFLTALDHGGQFDCIVSDVRMPGMTGLDLMRRLNERTYTQPVRAAAGLSRIQALSRYRLMASRFSGVAAFRMPSHCPLPGLREEISTNQWQRRCRLHTGNAPHCPWQVPPVRFCSQPLLPFPTPNAKARQRLGSVSEGCMG